MIDKKTFWIGVMTIVAAVLLAAHAMQPGTLMPVAGAKEVADHRDWSMVTAETAAGGEVLYVLDNRSCQLALLSLNTQARRPELSLVRSAPTMFNQQ
jgi:hypothetical protein